MPDEEGLRPRTFRAIAWGSLGSVTSQIVSFGAVLVVTRLLNPIDFGTMAIATAIAGLATTIADTGVAQALTQRDEITESEVNTAFWWQLTVGLLTGGVVFATAGLTADIFHRSGLRVLMVALACAIPVQAVGLIPRSLLVRKLQMNRTAVIDVISAVGSAAAGITAAILHRGVQALLLQALIAVVVTSIGGFLAAGWRPRASARWADLKGFSAFTGPLYGYKFVNYLVRNGDNILVGRFLGPFQLGLYSRAYTLLLFPSSQITSVVGGPMQVSLSRMAADKARSRRVYLETCRHIAFLAMPTMLFIAVLADDFVRTLMGPHWIKAIPAIRTLAIVGIVEPLATTCGWLYFAQSRTDLSFRLSMVGGPVYLAAIYLGVQGGSAFSVALSYLLVNILMIPVLLAYAGGLIGVRLRDYAREAQPALTNALLSGVFVYLSRQGMVALGLSSYWRLPLAAGIGALIYLGLGSIRRLPEMETVASALRVLRTRARGAR